MGQSPWQHCGEENKSETRECHYFCRGADSEDREAQLECRGEAGT